MKKIIDVVKAYQALSIFLALVVIGIGYYAFAGGSGAKEETYTVVKGPFEQRVSVSGTVVAGNEVDLGFSQSGRVSGVYVIEGQKVLKGTLIAEVDNADLYAAVASKRAALGREEARLAALERGARPEELAVADASVHSAETTLVSAEQSLRDAMRDAYAKSDAAVHIYADQQFNNASSNSPTFNIAVANSNQRVLAENTRLVLEAQLRSWAGEPLLTASSSDLASYSASSKDRVQSVGLFLSAVSAALESAQPSSGVSQTVVDAYKATISTQRSTVALAQTALTTAENSLTAAKSALAAAQSSRDLTRAGASIEDVNAQRAIVAAASADVGSALAQLGKSQVRAPFSGTISKLDAKVGKVVSPNESQVTLIGEGVFQIESYVPEINVGFLKKDDTAEVLLDAITDRTYHAKVNTIDVGESVRDGVSTYRTTLVFSDADEKIRSGMTANVEILTEQKDAVISIPLGLVRFESGKKLVTIKDGKKNVDREVVTGAISSLGQLEIYKGLSVGDILVVPAQ